MLLRTKGFTQAILTSPDNNISSVDFIQNKSLKLQSQRYYDVDFRKIYKNKNLPLCVENILPICLTHCRRSSYEYLVLPLRRTSLVIWAASVCGSSRGPTPGRKNTTNTLQPFVYELKPSLGFWSQSASRGVSGLTEGSVHPLRRPEAPWRVSVCVTGCLNIYRVNIGRRAVSVQGEHVNRWLCTLVSVGGWKEKYI